MDKTLIISSNKESSITTLALIDSDIVRWKVIVNSDNDNEIQIYKGGDDNNSKQMDEMIKSISIAEALGTKLLNHQVSWTTAEIRSTCPNWNGYTIILCIDGNISISEPDDSVAAKTKEGY